MDDHELLEIAKAKVARYSTVPGADLVLLRAQEQDPISDATREQLLYLITEPPVRIRETVFWEEEIIYRPTHTRHTTNIRDRSKRPGRKPQK